MDHLSATTYLNTAAWGLLEAATVQAANSFYTSLSASGSNRSEQWRAVDEPRIRASAAAFIGAQPANVASSPNFSWALNGIVQALSGTEKVMLYSGDYPSVTEPFRINNFSIKWIGDEDGFTLPEESVRHAITNREVDIVVMSHIQYNSGYKLDIQAIGTLCKENGVQFIVDATQSLGAIPADMDTIHADIFIASNYKWMNAGFGTAIMYMSDAFLQKYPPVVGGNNSFKNVHGTMAYTPSVQSYEPGHANMGGLTIMEAAINHKLQLGVAGIEQHNNMLTALLLNELRELPVQLIGPATMDNRTSMVLLKDVDDLSAWLRQHNIVTTNRNGMVRISMHYHNTEADVMQLIGCMHRKFS